MKRRRRFLPWLRLLRLPNAFSTAGDLLAGCALAATSLPRFSVMAAGLAALALLYTGGMALNDWSDRERDRTLHPDRPLPAGEILPHHALAGAAVLLGLGFALVVWSLGNPPLPWRLGVAAGLLGAIVLYDLFGAERAIIGPIAMGLCRAQSMALGFLLAWGTAGITKNSVAAIAAYGLLVTGLTALSQHEAPTFSRGSARRWQSVLACGMTVLYLAPVLLFPGRVALLLPCGLILALWVLSPLRGARVSLTVKRGVFTLVLFDGLICLGSERPELAVVCVLLYAGIQGSARLISQRGS
ncbi:MAG TPA: hypothetical protein ENK43_12235 [Planctomycetes bacterium]|nr:hypothetical protein [Planctomycetota bacterium]